MNGAGHGVVAVVHHVWSPAVAPHALGAVVSGHSQVLEEDDGEKERMEGIERYTGQTSKNRTIMMSRHA